jgi:hypothetical protein
VIYALYFFAAVQTAIGVLVFFLPRVLGWEPALASAPRLLREVYHVHALFLALTLWIFAGLTIYTGGALGPLGFCIGVFWAVRVAVQLFYYSPAHWRGRRRETAIHLLLLTVYGSMSATYLVS